MRTALARTLATVTALAVGLLFGVVASAQATSPHSADAAACRAAAERAETLVTDYADAYAAQASGHPHTSHYYSLFERDGSWYVQARKACGS